MVELLSIEDKNATKTVKDVQACLEKEVGVHWGMSTLNQNLNWEHSQQKAVFEDPRKWTPANCHLYNTFLLWRLANPTTLSSQGL